jgi:hypothetical protein
MNAVRDLADLNQVNRTFWEGLQTLMDDKAVLETAAEVISEESVRGVALDIQKSFPRALRDAQRLQKRFKHALASLGG